MLSGAIGGLAVNSPPPILVEPLAASASILPSIRAWLLVTSTSPLSVEAVVEKETIPTRSPAIAGAGFGASGFAQVFTKFLAAHCSAPILSVGLAGRGVQVAPIPEVVGVLMLPDLSNTIITSTGGLSLAHARVDCGNPATEAPWLCCRTSSLVVVQTP